MESLADIVHFFTSSPEGRAVSAKAKADAAIAAHAQRVAGARRLRELQDAELASVKQFDRELESLNARVTRLRADLATAERAAGEKEAEKSRALFEASRVIDRLRGELRATASPLIGQFVSELRGLIAEAWKQSDAIVEKNIAGRPVTIWSNAPSVAARSAAIQRMIAEDFSEPAAIWYEALTDADLIARFDACRASLPAIELRPRRYHFRGGDDDAA